MTFYFYDLETSGISAKSARIMQFAGQRTDMDLNPIGEPHDILIKMTDDILPEPDAVMVTGITPQKTIAGGVSEAEFLQTFHTEVALPDTIFVGFNSVRFDDEFMRYTQYRNYYDPYEWQWKDGRSRWDLLDLVRMTRALRPEGIEWPFDSSGKPSNRLELLTSVNKLSHESAHDALSDVHATIEIAKLIKQKQPKLFDFLLDIRSKNKVQELVDSEEMFIYTSGKYSSVNEKTTIVTKLCSTPEGAALVYDLSIDPTPFLKMSQEELLARWQAPWKDPAPKVPVKTLKFNRCPAVAPLAVLDSKSQKRIKLDPKLALKYREQIAQTDFSNKCLAVIKKMNSIRNVEQKQLVDDLQNVDERLYEAFIAGQDKITMSRVRAANPSELNEISSDEFKDERLKGLLPLYKARNFSKYLNDEERIQWEKFRTEKLLGSGSKSLVAKYMKRLKELDESVTEPGKRYLLEELQLYAESILPIVD